jgi:hypothetical protein
MGLSRASREQKEHFDAALCQPLPQPGQVVHPQVVEDQHVPRRSYGARKRLIYKAKLC